MVYLIKSTPYLQLYKRYWIESNSHGEKDFRNNGLGKN
jgi:hypothetical protein